MTNYFTRRGHRKYLARVERLTQELRELQKETQHNAETGGNLWHDNFSYEELRRQMTYKSDEIRKAREALVDCKVVDIPASVDKVVLGSEVVILRNGIEETYRIRGFDESEPEQGILAYNTPLVKAIMGQKPGYSIEKKIGDLVQKITVLEVKPINREDSLENEVNSTNNT